MKNWNASNTFGQSNFVNRIELFFPLKKTTFSHRHYVSEEGNSVTKNILGQHLVP